MLVFEIMHLLVRETHLGTHVHNLLQQIVILADVALTIGKIIRALIKVIVVTTFLHQVCLLHVFKHFDL